MLHTFCVYFQKHFVFRLAIYFVICLAILNIKAIWERVYYIDRIYWGACVLTIILFIAYERGLSGKKERKNRNVLDNEPLYPLIDDQPTTEDRLGRDEYVRILGQKIVSTFVANLKKYDNDEEGGNDKTHSAFAINIEEDYGYGKTSFLMMLHRWFEEEHDGQFTWIEFKPWLCDNVSSLIFEFFHELAQELNINVNLQDDIVEYGNALATQVIKFSTGIHFSNIFKCRESSLKSMHDNIRDELSKLPQLIIVTIDDLDRLDKSEVLAVLKLIRNAADFSNIFYITATEHTYLYNVLLADGIKDPDRYIEKFFNLHFYLPAHEMDFGDTFFQFFYDFANTFLKDKRMNKEFKVLKNEPILKTCFNDIRDVKRFVNQLVIYLESLEDKDFNLCDATLLALLQYKCPDIYKILRDSDDILLGAKSSGTDSILELKDDPVSELRQREFQHMMDKDKQQASQEKEEPIKDLSERYGNERPYRNEQLGERVLNILFGSKTSSDEFAIKRTNRFFLYFSGKEHSKSITKAEATAVMKMDIKSYKTAVDTLFKQGRAYAFLQEMEYVVRNAKETDILDIIRKIFYFQYCQYDFTPTDRRRERSWYAINIQSRNLFSLLYILMGDSTLMQYRRINKPCPDLTPIMKEEPLIYVVELVSVMDRDISEFEYQRESIDKWVKVVHDRFLAENLKQNNIFTEDNLRLMEYFRDELFLYRKEWDESFSEYLCSDITIVRVWLSEIIIDYGGRYEWNYSVKRVMFGSTFDYRGKELMTELKIKYCEFIPELNSLESLLSHKDIAEMSDEIKDYPIVKEYAKKTI